MQRTLISDCIQKIGEDVKVYGWVHAIRDQGSIKFIILRDISGTIQNVITKSAEQAFETAGNLHLESVIEITGLIKEEKQAPDGIEIEVKSINVLSEADSELPIPVVEKAGETDQQLRLDWRWIDLRKPENALIFKVWTEMEQGFRNYWINNDYIEIHSPKFMDTPSESGAELFEVIYFNRKAYLAQSPQFYKQMGMSSGFEKVFEVGPVFRANPSFTSRHDTEFTGYDVEISFIDSHQDVIKAEQEMIVVALTAVKKKYGQEIKRYYSRDLIIPTIPFPQITLTEAKKILAEVAIASPEAGDLNPEEERKLSELIFEKFGHEFVYVTEYPKEKRAFYHMRLESDLNLTKGFDLLWNGLEITTGAQREHRYQVLAKQAQEKGLNLSSLKNYLNFFKYGCPPHGGFGLGPSRMLMKIFNIANVREVTYLYRGVNRLTP